MSLEKRIRSNDYTSVSNLFKLFIELFTWTSITASEAAEILQLKTAFGFFLKTSTERRKAFSNTLKYGHYIDLSAALRRFAGKNLAGGLEVVSRIENLHLKFT